LDIIGLTPPPNYAIIVAMTTPTHAGGLVVVVGTVNLDLCFAVDRLPLNNETLTGAGFSQVGGGKGANTAAAAAASAATSVLIAAVGDDDAGAAALAELRGYGVDTSFVQVIPGIPTGRAGIVTAPTANTIVVAAGANAHLNPTHLRWALGQVVEPSGSGVCLISGELGDELIEVAALAAADAGLAVAINLSPARSLSSGVVRSRPLVIVNEVEASQLVGSDNPAAAARLLRDHFGSAVVTRGADGAIGATDAEVFERSALEVECVDTVGAGDAFAGALVAVLSATQELTAAVDAGIAAGARAVRHRGARTWITN